MKLQSCQSSILNLFGKASVRKTPLRTDTQLAIFQSAIQSLHTISSSDYVHHSQSLLTQSMQDYNMKHDITIIHASI